MAVDRLRQQVGELLARRYVRVGTVAAVSADGRVLDVRFADGAGDTFVVPGVLRVNQTVAPQVGDMLLVQFPEGRTDTQGYTER